MKISSEDVNVHFINELDNQNMFSNIPLLEVKINDKVIIYDCEDGYPFREDWMLYYLPRCDFYFKRSYSKNINLAKYRQYCNKIYPLGLNYYVTCKHNPYNFKFKTAKERVRILLKNIITLDGLYDENRYVNKNNKKNGVIFMTRLWEPISKDALINEHRNKINNERIELVRALRLEFGENFYGGIERSELAEQLAPDLILPKKYTQKKNYLRLMKNAKVGIATTGLHNSIGWKFCEYLAAGLLIVSEKLNYEVPGDFKKGVEGNYLEYSSIQECIAQVSFLMKNESSDICEKMIERNRKYYESYVSPKACVINSLRIAGIEI